MNYHFTTTKAHITRLGGHVEELVKDEGLVSKSTLPFKGNIDLEKLEACIQKETPENVAFIRVEAGTNLIGGQPISYENMKAVTDIAKKYGILTVMDASLLQDNLYFIKIREESMKEKSIELHSKRLIKRSANSLFLKMLHLSLHTNVMYSHGMQHQENGLFVFTETNNQEKQIGN